MKKKYFIEFEWEIRDTRNVYGGYRTGRTSLAVEASNRVEAINHVINFASSIPTWEVEKNGIDLEDYRNKPYCSYFYITAISKVLSIKVC